MDKKQEVYDFIKFHKEVFQFQLVFYFSQRHCISADRLARFLVAEGKLKRRGPTEEEKVKFGLKTRTIIYYIPGEQRRLPSRGSEFIPIDF